MTFTLTSDYIELNKLLKFLGIMESGGQVKQAIIDGGVLVNNEIEYRIRRKMIKGDTIIANNTTITIQ